MGEEAARADRSEGRFVVVATVAARVSAELWFAFANFPVPNWSDTPISSTSMAAMGI